MGTKHTEVPWGFYKDEDGNVLAITYPIGKTRRGEICAMPVTGPWTKCVKEEINANAAHIVKCVNNFDAMLAELERLYALFGHCLTDQIIASAKGETT